MSFELRADETVEHGVKRIVAHQLDALVSVFAGKSRLSQSKMTHDARKRLKKLRALLRLIRGSIGRHTFQELNKLLRDIGRTLSPSRDASVLVTSFNQLLKHFREPSTKLTKSTRSNLLRQRRELAGDHLSTDQHRRIIKHLRTARSIAKHLKLKRGGWPAIREGLQWTYRDGRKAFRIAVKHPQDDTLHEWRKRAKDWLHQLQLLAGIWPKKLEPMADEIHQLADWLGDDHDLAMLRQSFKNENAGLIEEMIDGRRKQLQAEAIFLGSRLYSRKPATFLKEIHGYWGIWRKSAAAMPS